MNPQLAAPTPALIPKTEEPFSDLATVSISTRIPDFWPENPRLWFIQVEAILNPQKTSDANKYYMVVSKLNKEAIQQVADILSIPPETQKFDTLKNRLLQIYEESETRQIQKLISEVELGDQKPSQLLHRMKELARGKIEDDTLNILWQGHLPASVRAVLTVTTAKNLEELAVIADKIMDTYQSTQLNEVTSSQQQQQSTSTLDIAMVMAEIAKINLKINEMSRGRERSRNRYRNFSRKRSSSRSRRTPDNPNWLCSYHFKFRGKAWKCVPPCNWKTAPARQHEQRDLQSEN